MYLPSSRRENIEYIRIEYLDYSGVIRSRTIHRNSIESALTSGVNFSKAIMSFTMFDRYVQNPTYGTGDGDFFDYQSPHLLSIYLIVKILRVCMLI